MLPYPMAPVRKKKRLAGPPQNLGLPIPPGGMPGGMLPPPGMPGMPGMEPGMGMPMPGMPGMGPGPALPPGMGEDLGPGPMVPGPLMGPPTPGMELQPPFPGVGGEADLFGGPPPGFGTPRTENIEGPGLFEEEAPARPSRKKKSKKGGKR